MKYLKLFIPLIALLLNLHAFGQNWAPFQVNKKILYSSPDSTIIPGDQGLSLALVMFDTSVVSGTSTTYFRKDMVGDHIPSIGSPLSYVALYGMKLEKLEHQYKMYWKMDASTGPILTYNPKAEVDEIILQGGNWFGIVTDKYLDVVNGQPDSVKLILLEETRSFLPPAYYPALISKSSGFIQLPEIFSTFNNDRPIFSIFGDQEDNLLGVNDPLTSPVLFQTGDVLVFSRLSCTIMSFFNSFCSLDTIKRHFLSTSGDSCLVLDSIKRTFYNPSYFQQIMVDTHKVKNQPTITSAVANAPIGRPLNDWNIKGAYLSEDSILYVGTLPTGGANDLPITNLYSTRTPLSRYSRNDLFSSFLSEYPIYLSHENQLHGDSIPIIFTGKSIPVSRIIRVYPNPGSDKILLTGLSGKSEIHFFNLEGKVAYFQAFEDSEEIQTKNLPAGIYFLSVRNGLQNFGLRWVKIN